MKIYSIVLAFFLASSALAQTPSASPLQGVNIQFVNAELAQFKQAQAQIASLQSQISALQQQLAVIRANPILQIGPYVTLDMAAENGVAPPNIVIHGANLHVVNGLGQTNLTNALGNLIIGYAEPAPNPLPNGRAGSHNLVLASGNQFTDGAFGGIVGGNSNTIAAGDSSIIGGISNTTNHAAFASVIIAGSGNVTGGLDSVVVSGIRNAVTSVDSVVLGGAFNFIDASAADSILLGGNQKEINTPLEIFPIN